MRLTRRTRWWRVAAAMALLGAASMTLTAQQADPRELFERARLLAENPRQTTRAIELYRQVASTAGDDRALAGAARLQEGLLLTRQGDAQGRSVLTRVAREYADVSAVAEAAEAGLAAQVAEVTPRRLGVDRAYAQTVSPDGLRVATTVGVGGLAIKSLSSSEWTVIVPDVEGSRPRFAVFSPDGRSIAFLVAVSQQDTVSGVSVIEASPGSSPRVVMAPARRAAIPVAWSPDGRQLLLWHPTLAPPPRLQQAASGSKLEWVDVATGALRDVRAFEPWQWAGRSPGVPGVALSPDGSTIAFSAVASRETTAEHIFLMDADGRNERVAVQLAGVNSQPKWTPDGGHLLFINERSGERLLMSVPIRGGKADGEPQTVQRRFSGDLLAMTQTGNLFYGFPVSIGFNMFIAERGGPAPRIVQTFQGQSGTWSKGGRIAFVRPLPQGHDLVVRDMATGEERLYQREGLSNVSPRWFSDDSALLVHVGAQAGPDGPALYRLDLASGTFTHALGLRRTAGLLSGVTTLSPDNSTVYGSLRETPGGPWKRILAVELATGAERVVFTYPGEGLAGGAPGIDVSPDGSTLAVHTASTPTQQGRIFTVRVDGTDYRELLQPPGGGWPDLMRWTPDGTSLVFVQQPVTGPTAPWRTMIVPAAGGSAAPDGLDSSRFDSTVPLPLIETGNVASIDLSPDGSQIVFGARTIPTFDLWVLENLPPYLAR